MTSAIQSFEAQTTLNLKIIMSRCPKYALSPLSACMLKRQPSQK